MAVTNAREIAFIDALRRADDAGVTGRAVKGIAEFLELLDSLTDAVGEGPGPMLEAVLDRTGYVAELQAEPVGKEGVAALTARLLPEGAAGMDGSALADRFERIGASVESNADWDVTAVSLTALTKQLPEALSLMWLVSRACEMDTAARLANTEAMSISSGANVLSRSSSSR